MGGPFLGLALHVFGWKKAANEVSDVLDFSWDVLAEPAGLF